MFKFSWHLFLTAAVLALAVVAGAVNVARVVIHSFEDDWGYWVELARAQAGASLTAEVEGDGFQWHPRIVLRNLKLLAPAGRFSGEYVEVRVDLLRSLWTQSLFVHHVKIYGCQLSLSAPRQASVAAHSRSGEVLRRLHVASYDLRDCRLNLRRGGDAKLRVSVERALAGSAGEQAWHSVLHGGIFFVRQGGDRAALSFHAPTVHIYSRGELSGHLFWRRTAAFAMAFGSPELVLRLGEAQLAITDVAGIVDGTRAWRSGWRGSMRGLRFQHMEQRVQVPSIPMASPSAGLYSALLHTVKLDGLSEALSSAGILEAMGISGPEQLDFGGTVTKLRFALDASKPGLPVLPEIEIHFEDLHARPRAKGLLGFSGVSGQMIFIPGLIWMQLDSAPIEIWIPTLYGERLSYQSLQTTLIANFYGDEILLEIPSADIRLTRGAGRVKAQGMRLRLLRTGALRGIAGQIVIQEMDFVELMDHMPLVAFNAVLPEWFATGTTAGILRELSVELALEKPEDIFDAANEIHATGNYHGWDLMIIKGLIFDNLAGDIAVEGVRATVTMHYDAAELFRAPMPGGKAVLRTTDSSWSLSVDSSYARAVFSQRYGDKPVYGHCDYVYLPNFFEDRSAATRVTTTAMRTFRASRLPETEDTVWVPVKVDSFHLGKYELGAWSFDVHAGVRKMLVDNMFGEKDGITLLNSAADGTGAQMVQWLDDDGGWITLFEGSLKIPDMAELFRQLDIDPLVTGKNGHLLATVSWLGELSDFDFQSLRGDIRFEMGRGEFPDVERPGILKVIGLLNFNNILHGLLPSLRSLKSHGLYFKEVQARAFLAEGQLRLDSGYGATVAANEGVFVLRGDADLAAGTLDGELDVTLHLAENLPLMALVAASGVPLIFAGTWLASKIVGSGVNRLAHVVYSLKGPWSDLQLSRPQEELAQDGHDHMPTTVESVLPNGQ